MPVVADQPKAAARWWVLLAVAVAGVFAPLVGHGCHGDDIDHEPAVTPRVYNQK
jgi:hypothetical protein